MEQKDNLRDNVSVLTEINTDKENLFHNVKKAAYVYLKNSEAIVTNEINDIDSSLDNKVGIFSFIFRSKANKSVEQKEMQDVNEIESNNLVNKSNESRTSLRRKMQEVAGVEEVHNENVKSFDR